MWIDTLHVDGAALLFAAALAAVVTVAAGLVPAMRLSGAGLAAAGPAHHDRRSRDNAGCAPRSSSSKWRSR